MNKATSVQSRTNRCEFDMQIFRQLLLSIARCFSRRLTHPTFAFHHRTSPTTIALDIQGTATHTHTVNLTQAEVTSIAARMQITSTSTTDSFHNHTVTFN